MLLVIDVGNTNTVLGVYDGDVLVDHWRIRTEREKTADEWGILFRDLFLFDKLNMRDFTGYHHLLCCSPRFEHAGGDGGEIFSCARPGRGPGH